MILGSEMKRPELGAPPPKAASAALAIGASVVLISLFGFFVLGKSFK